MRKKQIFNLLILMSVSFFAYISNGYLGVTQEAYNTYQSVLSNQTKTIPAKQSLIKKVNEISVPTEPDTFRIKDRKGSFVTDTTYNPFDLSDPAAIKRDIRYDTDLGLYVITETIGGVNYRPPMYMTFEEYLKYSQEQEQMAYFRSLNKKASNSSDPIDQF